RRHGGRRDLAARELEINRSTLFNKMRKYDLLHVDFSRADRNVVDRAAGPLALDRSHDQQSS
ncbi:MAG: helix-turn-helix domain-containing protein, partial [Planctomycetota bacterium]